MANLAASYLATKIVETPFSSLWGDRENGMQNFVRSLGSNAFGGDTMMRSAAAFMLNTFGRVLALNEHIFETYTFEGYYKEIQALLKANKELYPINKVDITFVTGTAFFSVAKVVYSQFFGKDTAFSLPFGPKVVALDRKQSMYLEIAEKISGHGMCPNGDCSAIVGHALSSLGRVLTAGKEPNKVDNAACYRGVGQSTVDTVQRMCLTNLLLTFVPCNSDNKCFLADMGERVVKIYVSKFRAPEALDWIRNEDIVPDLVAKRMVCVIEIDVDQGISEKFLYISSQPLPDNPFPCSGEPKPGGYVTGKSGTTTIYFHAFRYEYVFCESKTIEKLQEAAKVMSKFLVPSCYNGEPI